MNDQDLLQALKSTLKQERNLQAQFLRHLSEVDERKLFLPKHTSLFQFCVKELGLSEASTCKRIQVARLGRQYPEILEKIAAGKLTMTNASLLAPQITQENHQELFAEAEGKSKYELQKKLAPTFAGECKEKLKPLTQSRTMFVFSGDDETVVLYRALQDRLRHKYPNGKLEEIVKEAFKLLAEKTDPLREPKRKSLPRTPSRESRAIPAHIRRLVWRRDKGQCRQCGSRAFLQIDHIVPWSRNGKGIAENLQLLCGVHNRLKGSSVDRPVAETSLPMDSRRGGTGHTTPAVMAPHSASRQLTSPKRSWQPTNTSYPPARSSTGTAESRTCT